MSATPKVAAAAKPKAKKLAAKDAGAKAARKFTIDCREPVNDEIFDTSLFVRQQLIFPMFMES